MWECYVCIGTTDIYSSVTVFLLEATSTREKQSLNAMEVPWPVYKISIAEQRGKKPNSNQTSIKSLLCNTKSVKYVSDVLLWGLYLLRISDHNPKILGQVCIVSIKINEEQSSPKVKVLQHQNYPPRLKATVGKWIFIRMVYLRSRISLQGYAKKP